MEEKPEQSVKDENGVGKRKEGQQTLQAMSVQRTDVEAGKWRGSGNPVGRGAIGGHPTGT